MMSMIIFYLLKKHIVVAFSVTVQKHWKQLHYSSFLVLHLSLGCGIGYGYLHRIPTRPAHLSTHNKSVLQTAASGSSEDVASADHTEVWVITSLFCFSHETF